MREKAVEFFKNVCKHNGNACVNYRPYKYGRVVESLSFTEAVDKFMNDFEDMKEYVGHLNITENEVFKINCDIWRKHIVVY